MVERQPRVIVIGAGIAGVTTGVMLKRAGFDDFRIIEKAPRVGGVWEWNRYPGIACDVPSQIYQFSFNPNPRWSRVFAGGEEIREYIEDTATSCGLDPHISLGLQVESAQYQDGRWRVRTSDGAEDWCDFLVAATGLLHHPLVPDFPGRESFTGQVVHSARWDPSIETAGKRIAIIGNGSTGVQLLSALRDSAAGVTLYSRHPQWVIKAPTHLKQNPMLSKLLGAPVIAPAAYKAGLFASGILADVTLNPTWRRRAVQKLARFQLRQVRDEVLRETLRPDYEPLCKRQVISGSYHHAVQQPDVTVLRQGVRGFTPDGLIGEDGVERSADLVILATGFKTHNYMRPMELVGRDGVTIDDAWADGPRAYRMSAIPKFPNLFTVLGPNSPTGSISLQYTSELTARWIVQWLERWAAGEYQTVEVTERATDEFNDAVREAMPDTVWATGCNSWYFTEGGSIDLWPFTRRTMRAMLSKPEPEHFEFTH